MAKEKQANAPFYQEEMNMYKLPTNALQDFCIAELFEDGTSTLLINYSNISLIEQETVLNNAVSIGMTVDNDDIIIYWKFAGGDIDLITPFDARCYIGSNALNLENTSITIKLIEGTIGRLMAERVVNLPQSFIKEIMPAINHQLSGNAKPINSNDPKWNNWPIKELTPFIKTFHNLSD